MHRAELTKPDGRSLTLYANHPLRSIQQRRLRLQNRFKAARICAGIRCAAWVTYGVSTDRTFLPPPQYNPLAVTVDPQQPTELPNGNWDIAVFDNRFPSLSSARSRSSAAVDRSYCSGIGSL